MKLRVVDGKCVFFKAFFFFKQGTNKGHVTKIKPSATMKDGKPQKL